MSDEEEPLDEKAGKRLTGAEYAAAREMYELNSAGITNIAEQFGVSRQALSQRFTKDGVRRGSRSAELDEITRKAAAATVAATMPPPKAVERYYDKRESWIEETRVQGYNALKQTDLLARRTVAEALKPPVGGGAAAPISNIDADLKTIERFQRIVINNLASRFKLLDADDFTSELDLPSLTIEDLTDADIMAHHAKNDDSIDPDGTLEDLASEIGGIDVEMPD